MKFLKPQELELLYWGFIVQYNLSNWIGYETNSYPRKLSQKKYKLFMTTICVRCEGTGSANPLTYPGQSHKEGCRKCNGTGKNEVIEILNLEQAKTKAIVGKHKIRHRFYEDGEFIEYKNSEWITEDGYVLPKGYFESMSGDWLHGWSLYTS